MRERQRGEGKAKGVRERQRGEGKARG